MDVLRAVREALRRGARERDGAAAPAEERADPEPLLRVLGTLPDAETNDIEDADADGGGVLGALRAQKRAGMRERAERIAIQRQREADEAARADAERQERRKQDLARDRAHAERAFAGLPDLIRHAAALGLDAAVLTGGFVDARTEPDTFARAFTLDGRRCTLRGWQAHFAAMCEEAGVPLTLVSESVEADNEGKRRRIYEMLAVDLRRL